MPRLRLRHAELPGPLTGWIAVNDLGLPRLWATIWADILMGRVAEATRGAHLAAVESLYRSVAEQIDGDRLDAIIAALDFDELEAVLGGFLARLRNESAIEGIDRAQTWQSALRFVHDVVNHIGRADGAAFAESKPGCSGSICSTASWRRARTGRLHRFALSRQRWSRISIRFSIPTRHAILFVQHQRGGAIT